MSISRDEWLQRHEAACQRRRVPVIESAEFTARRDGGFDVVIRGRDLAIGAMPNPIRIGGRPLKRVAVPERGRIEGVVDDVREGEEIVAEISPDERVTARAGTIT